jgi:hypothetical protein
MLDHRPHHLQPTRSTCAPYGASDVHDRLSRMGGCYKSFQRPLHLTPPLIQRTALPTLTLTAARVSFEALTC